MSAGNRKNGARRFAHPRAGHGEFVGGKADVLQWRAERTCYPHWRCHSRDSLRFLRAAASDDIFSIGYGAGTADLEGQPNVVRFMIGEPPKKHGLASKEIAVVEVNLDDMNPQIYGYFLEKALAAGALDVYTTPVQMKKNRPGTLLTVLCKPPDT